VDEKSQHLQVDPSGFPHVGTDPLQNPVDKHSSILAPWIDRPGAQSNLTCSTGNQSECM
jgi:hypothetical protein